MHVNLEDACLSDHVPCVHVSENCSRLVFYPVFILVSTGKRCNFHFAVAFYEIVQEKTTLS